ncbi:MAG: shikimate dehydrogenase [Candidatus Bathyarchaeota archaeon]|nr:shikimate dehydrogenase [Candidatus Termiticorpusculum sp.]MCL1971065.1 shikimate dehydrogenase [Candidatus Termiticorpusculum sp.]
MTISGRTGIYAVIGDPIEHSLSPIMQNAAFNALNMKCIYTAFRVKSSDVTNALAGMRALGVLGLNVTMPHKEAVIAHLDWIEETAKFLNSVNTIQLKDEKLLGYSTDGIGALMALRENRADPQGKRVLILGAGGAARAMAYALIKEADEIAILNRTVLEAEKLSETLKSKFNKKIITGSLSPESIREKIKDTDILLNATSVGMKPNINQSLITPDNLKADLTVMDLIYNPLETQLVKYSKAAGARVISGIEMLIYQGAAAFEIWTGQQAPVQVMRKAILEQKCWSVGYERRGISVSSWRSNNC